MTEIVVRDGCAVETHGLTKRYAQAVALDQVELRVPDGAVYALVGMNGAGKSTLFKLLMNLVRPDAGSAQVFGLDTGAGGPAVRAQQSSSTKDIATATNYVRAALDAGLAGDSIAVAQTQPYGCDVKY